MATDIPLLLETDQLEQNLDNDDVIIVDLCKNEQYQAAHIPGAIHIEYPQVISARPPVMGLLPEATQLNALAASIGLQQNKQVVAYDDEGGGKAARLLWTLHAMGHSHTSLLNGGLHAWSAENRPMENKNNTAAAGSFDLDLSTHVVADREFILNNLNSDAVKLLDARSAQEFSGEKKFAERGGHIPGAVNIDWLLLMDQANNLRLKTDVDLHSLLQHYNIHSEHEVVVYCQTHHRSALSYIALKHLGFNHVRGYPGSWSDWGNSADTPVES
ncbi:MAG: sulfurtransferase [Gammaproteobacteria bacterium]|nr:sulfurtransferase [Gammaproteobacteria bacterium]MDH5800908.1 sulfurtransferase [Gammaproteobacteria bacterium]